MIRPAPSSADPPLLVWGAGAMGGSIGGVLARAGHRVRFVDRDRDHVEAMRRHGLRITGPVSEFTVPADVVTPAEVAGRYPRVLLCVKAHHTGEAVEALRPHLADEGWVLSIQNGLNEPLIAARVGAARTLGAFVNFGADLLAPGVVHRGNRGAVVVGELDGRRTPRLAAVHALLEEFEPHAVATDNLFGFLWSKLAYAALLFATALTDDAIADVLAEPGFRPILAELAREVCRVAEAEGVRLEAFDGFDPGAFRPGASQGAALASLDDLVAFNRASAKTHSGIWRDLAVRRRRTEVDAQLGPVVAAGRRHGIPTPLTAAVVAAIHDLEEGRRERGRGLLAELAGAAPGGPS